MTSKVEICNLALSAIRSAEINDIDEPTDSARACARWFDHVRRNLLSKSFWSFARGYRTLGALKNDQPELWGFRFGMPSGLIKIHCMIVTGNLQQDAMYPFLTTETGIYTQVKPQAFAVVKDVNEAARFTPAFTDAFTYELAARIATPITGEISLAKDMFEMAREALNIAIVEDASAENDVHEYLAAQHEARL